MRPGRGVALARGVKLAGVSAGILARNALYFCKVAAGAAVCDEQSDWHLLRERTGRGCAAARPRCLPTEEFAALTLACELWPCRREPCPLFSSGAAATHRRGARYAAAGATVVCVQHGQPVAY